MQFKSRSDKPVFAVLVISVILVFFVGFAQTTSEAADPQVAVGWRHMVGLKSDGKVLSGGLNIFGQGDVDSWQNITQLAAAYFHSVGLQSDGKVVGAGSNGDNQLDVGTWTDIVQVAAGYRHTVGLKSNGTVVGVGTNTNHEIEVGSWTDIILVATGYVYTVGLKSDGSVVGAGDCYGECYVDSWNLILKPDAMSGIQILLFDVDD